MAVAKQRSAKLTELIHAGEALEWAGPGDLPISGIAYHSGRVEPGCLFVATPGQAADGHDYIDRALEAGAAAVVYSREIPVRPGAAMIRVADTRLALARCAARFYGHPSRELTVVGITGTNGKTTTTFLLESILRQAGFSVGVIGTINYRYGGRTFKAPTTTPQSLDLQRMFREMREEGVSHVVMEVSSHALEQRRVDEVDFKAAAFTNLTHDHLDYHTDMEDYFRAKFRLFTLSSEEGGEPPAAVVNVDDSYGRRIVQSCGRRCLSYGFASPADLRAEDVRATADGLSATLIGPSGTFSVSSRLVGRINGYNILAAAGVALSLGISSETVARGIAALESVPGRLFPVRGATGVTVFVDYAHTPDALQKTLESVKAMASGRVITVFGCGGNRDRTKRPVMGRIAGSLSDVAVVTSDNPRNERPMDIILEIEAGVKESGLARFEGGRPSGRGYAVIEDRAAAIARAVEWARTGDIVLIAGKGHENYQIVGSTVRDFDDVVEARKALGQTL